MKQVCGADLIRRVDHASRDKRKLEARLQRPTMDGAAILAGEDIVCLTQLPWHAPWKTSQQLMSVLAAANRVLYVGPPSSLREAVGARTARGRSRTGRRLAFRLSRTAVSCPRKP